MKGYPLLKWKIPLVDYFYILSINLENSEKQGSIVKKNIGTI